MKNYRFFSLVKMIVLFALFSVSSLYSTGQQRFPHPEFETNYQFPEISSPQARLLLYSYLDVVVLLAMLVLMTWFVLKKRSRLAVFWLSLVAIAYFGFWKKGCVCSIGAIQNVSLGIADPAFIVPVTTLLLFLLPLVFALFFGRVFCSGVCFMGALQDLVIVKPQKLTPWLNTALGTIPYLYLGFTILFAATHTDFLICRFDPFIGFFRFSTNLSMYIFGAAILISGMFIARPYCRFICPYGVLLQWASWLSRWKIRITPAECINCHLCANSCPVDAIQIPNPEVKPEKAGPKKLLIHILTLPLIMLACGFLFSFLSKPLETLNPSVELSLKIESRQNTQNPEKDIYLDAFYASGTSKDDLKMESIRIQKQFDIGCWILGLFLGLALGIGFIKLSRVSKTNTYIPDQGKCVACARCYKYCPVDNPTLIKPDSKLTMK